MTSLWNLYIRLDQLQRKLGYRLAASAMALIVCVIVFGSLISTSYRINGERLMLIPALSGQNYLNNDELALSLKESGEVTIDGVTYTSQLIKNNPDHIFNEDGSIGSAAYVAERLLDDRIPIWSPDWLLEQPGTTWMLAFLTIGWLFLVIWLDTSLPLLMLLIGGGLPIGIGLLLDRFQETLATLPILKYFFPWFLADEQVMLYIAGLGLFTFTFVLLTRLFMALYSQPNQVLAVAHTVMKEASRTKLSLVFIVLLLLILPLLPLALDGDSPLRFRIQTFISRSFATTFSIAAVLTIFLSCASVAFEIRDRQIWQLMTKPMNRLSYLAGKWVGVMTLNLIILIVAGLSTFTYIQYLRKMPVAPGIDGQLDSLAVQDQVLTARISIRPDYQILTDEQMRDQIELAIEEDSELSEMEEVPLAVRRSIKETIEGKFENDLRTVPSQAYRTYLFTGLEMAKTMQSSMTLRYRFYIMHNDEHAIFKAIFRFNDDPTLDRIRNYVPTQSHIISIGTDLIREDGTVKLDILNTFTPSPDKPWQGALNFDSNGLELLYKVANFEGNFFRAILVMWFKLSFLSALGIACATILSFPVACMTSFTIFIAGLLAPFVGDSLATYTPMDWDRIEPGNIGLHIQWVFTWIVNGLAQMIVFTVRGFGEYKPTQSLVEGKLIPWIDVLSGFFWLGLVWSGTSVLIGYLIIKNRQLAIYSGQG